MYPVWIMDLLRKRMTIPVISSIHSRSIESSKLEDSLRGYLYKNSNHVIAVSNHLKNELISRYGEIDNLIVIYNGVTKSSNKEILRKQKLITYCGRLVPTKGVDILIKAFSIFVNSRSTNKEYILEIIGDGECKNEYLILCKELKIENNIKFIGQTTNCEARKRIRTAMIHIVPSLYEPFATSALEAMAEGTAVIASNVVGLKEMIDNEENGILVKPKDEFELAKAIENVLNDKQNIKLTKNAKIKVENFLWDNISNQVMNLYKKCLHL